MLLIVKMLKRKKVREKGKIRLSEYFKDLKKGERVAIKRDLGLKAGFPKRMQGRTGIVEAKRGKSFIVKIKDYNKEKTFIIPAIHLKRIKTSKISKAKEK